MPRKSKENWAIGVVTIFLGLLAIAVTIITSNFDNINKEIGLLTILVIGYITYNEFSKLFGK